MTSITKKSEVKEALGNVIPGLEKDPEAIAKELHVHLLSSKVKFPLLEYCGEELYQRIPLTLHEDLCEEISALKTIGGDVIIAQILSRHLNGNVQKIFSKAAYFISLSGTWHATDIIGERVFGQGLLHHFDAAFVALSELKFSDNKWIVRSIGPGCHNAVKNGLGQANVKKLFDLLLSLADAKEYHIKTGIGWAAKTIAKFHPEVIDIADLENKNVGQWFRTKVRIGLERNRYAKGN